MKIKKCRVCKSRELQKVFDLGKFYYTGIFPSNKNIKVPSGKLSLTNCNNCSLLQLEDNFNSKLMYGKNYGYMSSLNKSMKDHLKKKANILINKYQLHSKNKILDIGSNDGTFLSFFKKKNTLFACDPTIVKFKKYYRKDIKLFPNFFSADLFKNTKFDFISTIAMFYDLPDPIKFCKNVRLLLKDDGVWHIELSYMPLMLKKNSYDTICHEHLEYYSLKSLKYLFDKAKLKIIKISFNEVNGGSISLDIAKNESSHHEVNNQIQLILKNEKKNKFNDLNTQKKFFLNCKKIKKKMIKLLKNLKSQNKKVYGYGASTKGNVILQYCGIDEKLLKKIVEINPFKFKKFTPGSKIPIISEKISKIEKPDYYLVLPWHFKKSILEREKIFLKKGGKMIFPLPNIQII